MIGTTRSRVSFFLKKFRKLDFMDDNHELHAHSSFLIVKHEDVLITNEPDAEAAPSCYRNNSYHLSNLDQTAADLLPIMARKRGDDGDRSIRTETSTSYTGGRHHERRSTQGEMDAIQR
jgi:hypothetical protein